MHVTQRKLYHRNPPTCGFILRKFRDDPAKIFFDMAMSISKFRNFEISKSRNFPKNRVKTQKLRVTVFFKVSETAFGPRNSQISRWRDYEKKCQSSTPSRSAISGPIGEIFGGDVATTQGKPSLRFRGVTTADGRDQ